MAGQTRLELSGREIRRLRLSPRPLLELIEKHSDAFACQIAEVYAARGESDAAFVWLERAYAQRDSGLSEMKINARFRALHGDPRWGAFLKKMRLED